VGCRKGNSTWGKIEHTHFGVVCGDVPKSKGVASPFGTTVETEF
jgi:hypothetical protein